MPFNARSSVHKMSQLKVVLPNYESLHEPMCQIRSQKWQPRAVSIWESDLLSINQQTAKLMLLYRHSLIIGMIKTTPKCRTAASQPFARMSYNDQCFHYCVSHLTESLRIPPTPYLRTVRNTHAETSMKLVKRRSTIQPNVVGDSSVRVVIYSRHQLKSDRQFASTHSIDNHNPESDAINNRSWDRLLRWRTW